MDGAFHSNNLNDAIKPAGTARACGAIAPSVRRHQQETRHDHPSKSQDRGYADHGWLKSHHSFSFAGYHDPAHMGWGNLRVINEDRIAPGTGFGTHGHRDMEIISYVLSGELAHKDSMGNVTGIPPGDVQRMSAGTGVHAQRVQPAPEPDHALPADLDRAGVQRHSARLRAEDLCRRRQARALRLVASPDGAEGSVTIHADAALYAGLFDGDESAKLALDPARKAYVHLVRGALEVNGQRLRAGDAALLARESAPRPDRRRRCRGAGLRSRRLSRITFSPNHTKEIHHDENRGRLSFRLRPHPAHGASRRRRRRRRLVAIDAEGNLPDGGWDTLNAADAIIMGSPDLHGHA